MNPWIPVLLTAAGSILFHLAISSYYYGRLTQKVSDVKEDVTEIKSKNLPERVTALEQRVPAMARSHHA